MAPISNSLKALLAVVAALACYAGDDPKKDCTADSEPKAPKSQKVESANPAAANVDPLARRENPWSEKVRGLLLVAPCATCHRSTLSTAVPRALLVFDLDKPLWHRTLTVEQAKELGRRAESLKTIDAFDRDAVARFVACRTGGDCTSPEVP